jgi:hypothetical protein
VIFIARLPLILELNHSARRQVSPASLAFGLHLWDKRSWHFLAGESLLRHNMADQSSVIFLIS